MLIVTRSYLCLWHSPSAGIGGKLEGQTGFQAAFSNGISRTFMLWRLPAHCNTFPTHKIAFQAGKTKTGELQDNIDVLWKKCCKPTSEIKQVVFICRGKWGQVPSGENRQATALASLCKFYINIYVSVCVHIYKNVYWINSVLGIYTSHITINSILKCNIFP